MEIKTKHSIGDKVWIIHNSKAVEVEIKSVIADRKGIYYSNASSAYVFNPIPETQCFPTKDELIKYVTAE